MLYPCTRKSITWNFSRLNPRFVKLLKNLSTASTPSEGDGDKESEHSAARRWLTTFDINTIPRKLGKVTFSRSSGPGGQNVNKVNSKATARFQMRDLTPLVPSIIHQQLQKSQYYAPNSQTLVIQADDSRKQSDNVDQCFRRLRDLILAAGKSVVKGETSPEQKARVKQLQKSGNESRLRTKSLHSKKKSARKSGLKD